MLKRSRKNKKKEEIKLCNCRKKENMLRIKMKIVIQKIKINKMETIVKKMRSSKRRLQQRKGIKRKTIM